MFDRGKGCHKQMKYQQFLIIFLPAMVSGIVTSMVLFFITLWNTQLQSKRTLVENLFACRIQYLRCADVKSNDFMKELDRIPIVFNNDKKVLDSLERFYEKTECGKIEDIYIRNNELVALLRQLCISAHFNCKNWNDSRFLGMGQSIYS